MIKNGSFEQGPARSSADWIWGEDSQCMQLDSVAGPDFWTLIYSPDATPCRVVTNDIYYPYLCKDTMPAQSGVSYIVHASGDIIQAMLITPIIKDSSYELSYYTALERFVGQGTQYHFFVKFSNNDSFPSPLITGKVWLYVDTIYTATSNSDSIEILSISGIPGDPQTWGAARIDNISLKKVMHTSIDNPLYHKLSIFPNPTTGKILFHYLPPDITQISITDLSGYKIISLNKVSIYNANAIDLSFLQNGFYVIQIKTNENSYYASLIISK